MAIKLITEQNMGDTTTIVNGKLELKVDPSPDNILKKGKNGLTASYRDVTKFIRDDEEVNRVLSGQNLSVTHMRDFCIFDRFNIEHRRLNSLSTSNTEPLVLSSSTSTRTLTVRIPFLNAGGRKAVGVFNLWYTFKNEPISDSNPVYVANILKCKVAGNPVSNCNPLMIINPLTSKYTVLSFTESANDFIISRLPDNTGMTIYIHFITLSGT